MNGKKETDPNKLENRFLKNRLRICLHWMFVIVYKQEKGVEVGRAKKLVLTWWLNWWSRSIWCLGLFARTDCAALDTCCWTTAWTYGWCVGHSNRTRCSLYCIAHAIQCNISHYCQEMLKNCHRTIDGQRGQCVSAHLPVRLDLLVQVIVHWLLLLLSFDHRHWATAPRTKQEREREKKQTKSKEKMIKKPIKQQFICLCNCIRCQLSSRGIMRFCGMCVCVCA